MSGSNSANRVTRCEGKALNLTPYVNAQDQFVYLLLISDEIIDTQLHTQAVIKQSLLFFYVCHFCFEWETRFQK